jgi:CHAD domain-containing protein
MDLGRIEKPLRTLRKLLKTLPENPAPAEMHKLRTRARRIEAVARALESIGSKETKRLLKAIKPFRKAAGAVRDIDVLSGNLLQLRSGGGGDARHRLIEHLGEARGAIAGKLLHVVHRQRKAARRELKRYARLLHSVASCKKPALRDSAGAINSQTAPDAAAKALLTELSHWPPLSASNLHSFRIKVKAVRSVLQTFSPGEAPLIRMLEKVKHEIGDWHDWQQLLEMARNLLDPRQDRAFLKQLNAIAQRKFAPALTSANALRRWILRKPGRAI